MTEKKLVDDVDCPECGGTGIDPYQDCDGENACAECNGNGWIERPNGST